MNALTCLEAGGMMRVKGTIDDYIIKEDTIGNLWTLVNGYAVQVKRNRGYYGWYKHLYGKVVVYPSERVANQVWSNLPDRNKCEVHDNRIIWYQLNKNGTPKTKFIKLGAIINEY